MIIDVNALPPVRQVTPRYQRVALQLLRESPKHVIVWAGVLVMVYPILWLFVASFKPLNAIFSGTDWLTTPWTFDNYINGWAALEYTFDTFFINSFIVCFGAVVGNLISCSMAAFAFARLRFKLKGVWFMMMLGSIMLPYHVLIVPQYVLFNSLDWINTYLPLIVPKFLATDAFMIFLLVQFIRGLPTELDDAAKIDGCSLWQLYWRIILPLALPALATAGIFTFLWAWSDFFSQLLFLTKAELYTVPIALRSFLDSTGTSEYGQMFAMSVLSLVPVFVLFIAFQRLLIEGVATTGLKG